MKNSNKIKVVIADDHDLYRDGLYTLLNKSGKMKVLGQACNGRDLVGIVRDLSPDVVVSDLRMPLMGGLEAIRQLHHSHPQVRKVVLSGMDDESVIIKAMEAGALGYVVKNAQRGEIADAVETVFAFNPYYCRSTSTQLARLLIKSSFDPYALHEQLVFSEKEKQVIALICEGRSGKQISELLSVSTSTVERTRAELFFKMNVRTTVGIAIYAYKNKLCNL